MSTNFYFSVAIDTVSMIFLFFYFCLCLYLSVYRSVFHLASLQLLFFFLPYFPCFPAIPQHVFHLLNLIRCCVCLCFVLGFGFVLFCSSESSLLMFWSVQESCNAPQVVSKVSCWALKYSFYLLLKLTVINFASPSVKK